MGACLARSPTAAPPASVQDGVLCNSEEVSRLAACEVMAELYGLEVQPDEFIPFTGTGEANFLGEGAGRPRLGVHYRLRHYSVWRGWTYI